jgi:hypothetical protein
MESMRKEVNPFFELISLSRVDLEFIYSAVSVIRSRDILAPIILRLLGEMGFNN